MDFESRRWCRSRAEWKDKNGNLRRWLIAGPFGLVAVITAGAVLPASASTTGNTYEEFCTPHLVRDYTRPFSRLPKVRELPKPQASDRDRQAFGVPLPFGPPAFHLRRTLGIDRYGNPITEEFSPVLTAGGAYGYSFSNENYYRALHLDWTVKAQLTVLNSAGGVKRTIAGKQLQITSIRHRKERHLMFQVPSRVGIYRINTEFADRFGQVLGRFSEYVRVVRPRVEVRLGIKGSSVRQGELVASRIENIGTATIVSATSFDVQRFDGLTWVPVPVDQGWEPYSSYARVGWTSNCTSVFEIPTKYQAGRYRVVKQVWPEKRHRSSFNLKAEFNVTD